MLRISTRLVRAARHERYAAILDHYRRHLLSSCDGHLAVAGERPGLRGQEGRACGRRSAGDGSAQMDLVTSDCATRGVVVG